ncbi:glutamyl-tRNA reductase [Bogoriella caseilytica]|uniref:Glutamyl-tRNA reductase n=1 Tax=Bogoriella caseilytica TaxID=56055 RepID=A0A3N2BEG8_9MICO|nr:glutamyl-tRNA reductase [Bogoriella caseilytica]ROR73651.1 glutamyl-tRNA reductase [Bogoriella caseilytica]
MPLAILAADHHEVPLPTLNRLSVGADAVGTHLASHPSVEGVVILSTCNRVEVYLDAHCAQGALAAAREALAQGSGMAPEQVGELTHHAVGEDVVQRVFEVAAGLDSMVVGEREIAGQLRRALQSARSNGTTSPLLEDVFQRASRASRRIAVETDLAAAGRSVVSVALDVASARAAHAGCPRTATVWSDEDGPHVPSGSWAHARALVLGTGAYAGATVAALRRRSCADIAAWSSSDRAAQFAAKQGIDAVPVAGLVSALAGADLVVSCRGTGSPVVDLPTATAALALRGATASPLVIVDLALRRDVDPAVADLPGIILLDLSIVRRHAPAATDGQVHRAQEIVTEEVDGFLGRRAERAMDDVVIAMREYVGTALEEELSKLPSSGVVDAAQVTQALRRLAAKVLHEPTVAARAAGREGRGREFVEALNIVTGAVRADEHGDKSSGATAADDDGDPTNADAARAAR